MASIVCTELMNINLCRSDNTVLSISWIPQENFPNEFITISPAGPRMSYCNCLCDGCWIFKKLNFQKGCFQDLFKTEYIILGWFPACFFSRGCSLAIILTQLQLGRIPVLFNQKNKIFIWLITCWYQTMTFLRLCWHYFQ